MDSAPPRSTPPETAAGKDAAGGKVDESRGSTATGMGGVGGIGASNANTNVGSNLARPAAGEGVMPRGGGGGGIDGSGAGTLAMNSPDSDNIKRLSSSSSSLQSALLPVDNASLQDSRPNSVPKDKSSSRGGAGGEGARKPSGSSHRRRREGHAGGGGDGGSSKGRRGSDGRASRGVAAGPEETHQGVGGRMNEKVRSTEWVRKS